MAYRKGFPTRQMRWCCEQFKEKKSPKGRRTLLGVRAEESPKRAERGEYDEERDTVQPIIEWASDEVWEFIRAENIPYCSLYDEGFARLGCIGCPLASRVAREREFARWPGYGRAWKNLIRRTWERRAGTRQKNGREWFGSALFNNWEELYEWWMSDNTKLPVTEDEESLLALGFLHGESFQE